jgi:hypothetical protein
MSEIDLSIVLYRTLHKGRREPGSCVRSQSQY